MSGQKQGRLRAYRAAARGRQVMTNMRPKTYFLRPDVALPMGIALLRELWAQRVSKRPDAYQASAGAA